MPSLRESMVEDLTMNKETLLGEWKRYGDRSDHYITGFMGLDPCLSIYLGTFMALDPCGHYHHMISPNGITRKCEEYWEDLEAAAGEVGGWIESGDGDPCDIYFSIPLPEEVG